MIQARSLRLDAEQAQIWLNDSSLFAESSCYSALIRRRITRKKVAKYRRLKRLRRRWQLPSLSS